MWHRNKDRTLTVPNHSVKRPGIKGHEKHLEERETDRKTERSNLWQLEQGARPWPGSQGRGGPRGGVERKVDMASLARQTHRHMTPGVRRSQRHSRRTASTCSNRHFPAQRGSGPKM